jgi:uncharacterized membrane protein YkvI
MLVSQRAGSFIDRILLPGLAFKACIIGGGYATGRELTEYFLSNGPVGGLLAMLVATLGWSLVCTCTFLFAFRTGSYDYHSFFRPILGPLGFGFEIVYFAFLILILSVFGAAAGEIGLSLFAVPKLAGTLLLIAAILLVVYSGQPGVERLFKYVSVVLYGVYVVFFAVSLWRFGSQVSAVLDRPAVTGDWPVNGIDYASYNVIAAVMILPVLRHQVRRRDVVISGLLCGPLAMAPALLFYICLLPFYPGILEQALPSDFVLRMLGQPVLRIIFQLMIFFALLESSVGYVQSLQTRIAAVALAAGRPGRLLTVAAPLILTIGSVFLASRIGLIELIARGYRLFGYAILIFYIAPLFLIGMPQLLRPRATTQFPGG